MQTVMETYCEISSIFPNNDLPKSTTQRITDAITVIGNIREEKRNGTSGEPTAAQTLNTGTLVGSSVTFLHPVGKPQLPPYYIPGNGGLG